MRTPTRLRSTRTRTTTCRSRGGLSSRTRRHRPWWPRHRRRSSPSTSPLARRRRPKQEGAARRPRPRPDPAGTRARRTRRFGLVTSSTGWTRTISTAASDPAARFASLPIRTSAY
jgi:hypothetical protein